MKAVFSRIGFVGTLLALIVIFLLMAAAPVAAQGDPRLAGRLPSRELAQVDSLLGAARAATLPVEPLVDRALEGAAKSAPAPMIVRAVARLLEELRTAQGAFGSGATTAELAAGASALRAGATGEDLATLRARRGQRSLTIPAAVLADLVATGVPADTAVAAVLALAANAEDADYVAFRRNVQRDVALGASPAAALGVRLSGVASDQVASPGAPGELTNSPRRQRKP